MPLGMSSNTIQDDQITASSYYDERHQPHFARLNHDNYWRPRLDDPLPWLQVAFDERMVISAVVLDGDWDINEGWIWLESFFIQYSSDEVTWIPYFYHVDEKTEGTETKVLKSI